MKKKTKKIVKKTIKKATRKVKSPYKLKDIIFFAPGPKFPTNVLPRVKELIAEMEKHNNGVVLMICKTNEKGNGKAEADGAMLAHNATKQQVKMLINQSLTEFGLIPEEFSKLITSNGGLKEQPKTD